MEHQKNGKMEGWNDGKQNMGILEEWNNGRLGETRKIQS